MSDEDKPTGEEEWEDTEWEEGDEEFFGEEDDDDELDDMKVSAPEESEEDDGGGEVVAEEAQSPEGEEDDEEDEEEEDEDEVEEVSAAPLPTEELQPLDPSQIGMNVAIEVGRLQLTAQQLMQMQSGNVLDLRVQPASGVDLVVNNQLVGRGELVQVGDSLAVRVLEVSK